MQYRGQSIEVTIDKVGNVKIDAQGFTDGSCHEATKQLEEALGVLVNRTVKTPMRQTIQIERERNLN